VSTLIAANTPIHVYRAPLQDIAELREAFRAEMNCQIVHDSIHYRRGWTMEFALTEGHRIIGYASLAVDGPWKDRPTLYEVYVLPERRSRAFALFDALLAAAQPAAFEVQSSDSLTTTLALTYARDIAADRVLFRDHEVTRHSIPGAALHSLTALDDIRSAMAVRQGGGEWQLELDGVVAGRGGILFHYNVPYGDVYMNVEEAFRGRGIGTYLVQELKRLCYELGATPAARCNPTNVASFRTLQRAGFLAYAHILTGTFPVGETTSPAPELELRDA
jgi:GNAT superfamily N-acetyltransferase